MNTAVFQAQLDTVLMEYDSFRSKSQYKDLSDLPKVDRQALVTKGIAAVHRISGKNSPYSADINRIIEKHPYLHDHTSSIMGVVQGLRDDIKAGYLQTLVELAHADLFADFIDMAQHLTGAGYKDAAAVVAGSTLESHLRALCSKNAIQTTMVGNDGKSRPNKADTLNSDLAKAGVYTKLDQKNVTAWLDLRNKAAHGLYGEYSIDQVEILIAGIREFVARNPA